MIEKGELSTSIEEEEKEGKKKVKRNSLIWTMLGMTNYLTDCFYLWGVG